MRIIAFALAIAAFPAVAQDIPNPIPSDAIHLKRIEALDEAGLPDHVQAARAGFHDFAREVADSPPGQNSGSGIVTDTGPGNPGNQDCCHVARVFIPVGPDTYDAQWLSFVQKVGDNLFVGTLINDAALSGYRGGTRMLFRSEHIADWTYRLHGMTHGLYGDRAARDPDNPEDAARLKTYAPLPEPQ